MAPGASNFVAQRSTLAAFTFFYKAFIAAAAAARPNSGVTCPRISHDGGLHERETDFLKRPEN
jgi:hypothetical protein